MVDRMVRFRTRTKLSPSFDDETQARGRCVSEKLFFAARNIPPQEMVRVLADACAVTCGFCQDL